MRREKVYFNTKFTAEVIAEASHRLDDLAGPKVTKDYFCQRVVQIRPNEGWDFETDEEFFAAYQADIQHADYERSRSDFKLNLRFVDGKSTLNLRGPSRVQIMTLAQPFEAAAEKCRIPIKEGESGPVIFIGHGQSPLWRDLKDHLHDKHGYQIEAYEIGARAGHAIRDILEDMLDKSSFALLVMTGEDLDDKGQLHARENVIHELGLFQGKLGFGKTIILLEEGTNEFSNIHGIHQIRFSKGNIKEIFGEVLATLKKEFGGI